MTGPGAPGAAARELVSGGVEPAGELVQHARDRARLAGRLARLLAQGGEQLADLRAVGLAALQVLLELLQAAGDAPEARRVGALQRVHAGVRNGRVRHLAVHRDLHLQAAVVRGHDLVGKARAQRQVGPGEALAQQPARAQLAAELLVVGEVQLDRAAQAACARALPARLAGTGGRLQLVEQS